MSQRSIRFALFASFAVLLSTCLTCTTCNQNTLPPPFFDVAPILTAVEPGEALPGDRIVLKGRRLLTPLDAHKAAVDFQAQDISLPIFDVTDSSGTVLVPPLAGGEYWVRIRYPGRAAIFVRQDDHQAACARDDDVC
ncbi:MAG: hypothetical protein HY343_03475 [Lentisphaerae bacterium]|nr:hypothetical protein [Lentisphaerota bacterium]